MSAAGTVLTREVEAMTLQEEIGTAAGAIWRDLASNGACTISKLQKRIDSKAPVFDWAIGWLAREDKIAIRREKRSLVVHLKET